jgi:AraC family transcriptional regulator
MSTDRQFLQLLSDIARRLDHGVSLASTAHRAGLSQFRLHREFRRTTGETLKQYTLRLQLERAAARLVAGNAEVMTVALTSGFASHEVFTRAFRRQFGTSPSRYRNLALATASKSQRLRHLSLTKSIGPTVRFFHHPAYKKFFWHRNNNIMPTLSIVRKEVTPQHILFIRRRIAPSELQSTLGECWGKLFSYGAKAGLPIAGWPICRYVSTGQGLWTIDAAMPLAVPAAGEGEMQAGVLADGPVALGIHAGPHDHLPDTNAAIERWIEANGYKQAGPTWEHYATDPTANSDPKDWRTEVYWPLEK